SGRTAEGVTLCRNFCQSHSQTSAGGQWPSLSREREGARCMELPDEAITYDTRGLLAPAVEEWTAAAELRARHFVSATRFKELYPRRRRVGGRVAPARELKNPPPEALPLEAGFINLPQELLDGFRRKQDASELGKVIALANRLKEESDRVVFLGTGGSYL